MRRSVIFFFDISRKKNCIHQPKTPSPCRLALRSYDYYLGLTMRLLWTFTLKYICSADLCSLIDGKLLRCHGEVAFIRTQKNSHAEHVHERGRRLRACPPFSPWHAHRRGIVLLETRPWGSERGRGTASAACNCLSGACALVVCDLGPGSPAVLRDAGGGLMSNVRQ